MNLRYWILNPSYIKNRIKLLIWQKQHKDYPWITSDAVNFLSGYLSSTDIGLEWGSGQSTVWFAKRVKSLLSIETDRMWYEKVRAKLIEENLHDVELKITAGDTYESLLEQCADISEESIDFVLVDGAINRHLTTEICIPLLKKGGLLIIDNINWYMPSPYGKAPDSVMELKPEWTTVSEMLRGWRCYWTTDGVSDTAIWFKTCGNVDKKEE